MAEKEAKIITPEGSPINSEDAAKLATDPTDIFNDLDKLRARVEDHGGAPQGPVELSVQQARPEPLFPLLS